MQLTGQKIGFIGLGLMGESMAAHLLDAGATLFIHNRTAEKARALQSRGAVLCDSPADMADKIGDGIIIACVTDSPALANVVAGEQGILARDIHDLLFIDMGTTAVSVTRDMAGRIAKAGGQYIDAPVSGGALGAQEATLSIMAGGTEECLARARPVFDILGKQTTRIGPVGAGQAAKAANQMIVGATINIVAEALLLAQEAGADMAATRQALLGGFASSRILDLHGQRMIDAAFTPGARATTQLKDMIQAADLATELGLDLAALSQSRDLWQAMADHGLGDLDQAGYFRFLQQQQNQQDQESSS